MTNPDTTQKLRKEWRKEAESLVESYNCCDGMNENCCNAGYEKMPIDTIADYWLKVIASLQEKLEAERPEYRGLMEKGDVDDRDNREIIWDNGYNIAINDSRAAIKRVFENL